MNLATHDIWTVTGLTYDAIGWNNAFAPDVAWILQSLSESFWQSNQAYFQSVLPPALYHPYSIQWETYHDIANNKIFDTYSVCEAFAYICENFGCPMPESYLIYNLYYNKTEPTEPDAVVYDFNQGVVVNVLDPIRYTCVIQGNKYPDRLRNNFYLPYDNGVSLASSMYWSQIMDGYPTQRQSQSIAIGSRKINFYDRRAFMNDVVATYNTGVTKASKF